MKIVKPKPMVKLHTVIGMVTLLALGQWSGVATAVVGIPDPTRPASWAKPSVRQASPARNSLVLQATLVSPSRRVAIISGRTYELGARVGRAVITDISAYEVTLTRKGRKTHLRFFPKLVEHKHGAKDASDGTVR